MEERLGKLRLTKKNRRRLFFATGFFAIGGSLVLLSRYVPGFGEWYARNVFPVFPNVVGRVMDLFPFSVYETILYLLAGTGLWWASRGVAALLCWVGGRLRHRDAGKPSESSRQPQPSQESRQPQAPLQPRSSQQPQALSQPRSSRAADRICLSLCLVSVVFCILSAACTVNYGRDTVAQLMGLSIQPSSAEELKELCSSLVADAEAVLPDIHRDQDGSFTIENFDVRSEAKRAMNRAAQTYDFLGGYYPDPKPVMCSEGMSYINLTGMYSPFTVEANYNAAVTDYVIPYTICHELAHLRGIIREDEAGFIAWLVCYHADDPQMRYSGAINALNYSLNALYREIDYQEYAKFYNAMPRQIRWDLWRNSSYWNRHRTLTYEIGRKANDVYLKVNAQEGGVKSYGRMVDLLLAYHRAGADLV